MQRLRSYADQGFPAFPPRAVVVFWSGMSAASHLSALEREAITSFVNATRARFAGRIQHIRLFGSRARGTGRSDSDLDIFVCLDAATREEKQELFDLAFDVGFANGLTISPLVAVPAQRERDRWVGQLRECG
jgi:predicted nucleotidyltransferase